MRGRGGGGVRGLTGGAGVEEEGEHGKVEGKEGEEWKDEEWVRRSMGKWMGKEEEEE